LAAGPSVMTAKHAGRRLSTTSKNETSTGLDDVFLLRSEQVDAYMSAFKLHTLVHSVSSAKALQPDFMKVRVAKGATFQRVIIVPTANLSEFIRCGINMALATGRVHFVAILCLP
jgi:DNA helicase-2/ATP-dependent DNA helicase PcrA